MVSPINSESCLKLDHLPVSVRQRCRSPSKPRALPSVSPRGDSELPDVYCFRIEGDPFLNVRVGTNLHHATNTYIQMMESAKKWRGQNVTNGMYCSRQRRVLVDRKVRASRVIVGSVKSQKMAKMPLAEHDNVVKTFPPDRTDRPFTISVLPRRSRRGWPIPNAHRRRRRMKTSP